MTSTEEIKTKSPVSTNILRIYNQKLVSSDEAVKHIKFYVSENYRFTKYKPLRWMFERIV